MLASRTNFTQLEKWIRTADAPAPRAQMVKIVTTLAAQQS